ncbi:MAG: DUF1266 domain-containing protein [Kluyvera sp.]|uniref:DUF1266 domain-containing protein n=1 Tax=Kluyvera sp. TaxID=1538228 RepID=UPI003A89F339
MALKIAAPLIVFLACETIERLFNLAEYKDIYHAINGIIFAWLLLAIVRYLLTSQAEKETPEFAIAKLYNAKPVYPLITDNERRAACAEALYLIGETSVHHASISYVNSLEQLDLNNNDDIKEARLLMSTTWNIDCDRALRKTLRQLITSATSCADIPMKSIAAKERYMTFLQNQGLPFQDVDTCPITGYDLVRASWLARIGFSVGYIDEQEARDFLNIIGELIQQQYSSWEQLTASYLMMYLEWNGGLKGVLGGLLSGLVAKDRILGARILLEDAASPFRHHDFPLYTSCQAEIAACVGGAGRSR